MGRRGMRMFLFLCSRNCFLHFLMFDDASCHHRGLAYIEAWWFQMLGPLIQTIGNWCHWTRRGPWRLVTEALDRVWKGPAGTDREPDSYREVWSGERWYDSRWFKDSQNSCILTRGRETLASSFRREVIEGCCGFTFGMFWIIWGFHSNRKT